MSNTGDVGRHPHVGAGSTTEIVLSEASLRAPASPVPEPHSTAEPAKLPPPAASCVSPAVRRKRIESPTYHRRSSLDTEEISELSRAFATASGDVTGNRKLGETAPAQQLSKAALSALPHVDASDTTESKRATIGSRSNLAMSTPPPVSQISGVSNGGRISRLGIEWRNAAASGAAAADSGTSSDHNSSSVETVQVFLPPPAAAQASLASPGPTGLGLYSPATRRTQGERSYISLKTNLTHNPRSAVHSLHTSLRDPLSTPPNGDPLRTPPHLSAEPWPVKKSARYSPLLPPGAYALQYDGENDMASIEKISEAVNRIEKDLHSVDIDQAVGAQAAVAVDKADTETIETSPSRTDESQDVDRLSRAAGTGGSYGSQLEAALNNIDMQLETIDKQHRSGKDYLARSEEALRSVSASPTRPDRADLTHGFLSAHQEELEATLSLVDDRKDRQSLNRPNGKRDSLPWQRSVSTFIHDYHLSADPNVEKRLQAELHAGHR